MGPRGASRTTAAGGPAAIDWIRALDTLHLSRVRTIVLDGLDEQKAVRRPELVTCPHVTDDSDCPGVIEADVPPGSRAVAIGAC